MREAIAPVSITRSRAAGFRTVTALARPRLWPLSDQGQLGSGPPWRSRTAQGAWVALVMGIAIVLAWALRAIGDQPIIYDADGYVVHAKILVTGPIEVWGFRTYGYPAFLVPWVVLAGRDTDL